MNLRNRVRPLALGAVALFAAASMSVPTVAHAQRAKPVHPLPPADRITGFDPPPPVPYYVHLDSFHVNNTRSGYPSFCGHFPPLPCIVKGTDTDSAFLGGLHWGPQDVKNGDTRSIDLVAGPFNIVPDGSARLSFSYHVGNNSGGYGYCDGTVAYDEVSFDGAKLAQLTASGSYSETRNYDGGSWWTTTSPPGCGSNSNYDVTWHISRNNP